MTVREIRQRLALRRLGAATLAALLGALLIALPALASQTVTTVVVGAGSEGTDIGDATLEREKDDTTGEETLKVTVVLDSPILIDEVHVCISDAPFTERQSPGGCPFSQKAVNASTATVVASLGTDFAGKTLYVQVHVATTDGETAFAGHQKSSGNKFFGNVALEDPQSTQIPATGAIGGAGLAAMLAAGLLIARRKRTAPEAWSA